MTNVTLVVCLLEMNCCNNNVVECPILFFKCGIQFTFDYSKLKIMKRTITLFSLLFCLFTINSQTYNQLIVDGKGNEKLLGKINREGLATNSFGKWFNKNHDNYTVDESLVKTLKDSLSNYEIKLFLGTWCGDSRREVPRLYKVLDNAQFSENQLEVIAVERTPEAYKKSPTGEEKGLNIHKVPTMIFYKDGKEVNRIVEHPKETFERDIYNIVVQKNYISNYIATNYLDKLFKQYDVNTISEMETELIPKLTELAEGSRELNSLGYIKLRNKKLEEALFIFKMNTKLFPDKSNVYDSLGEAYFESKNYIEALKNYYKVLSLVPNDKHAKKMVAEIENINY